MNIETPNIFPNTSTEDIAYESGDFLSFDDTNIHYEIRGSGPVILFSNNFFMSCEHWRAFTQQITKHFTVINYDLRHQGQSGRVEGNITIDDHVKDLTLLTNKLNLSNFQLLGTCVSTLICLEFALQSEHQIDGIVMVGPIYNPFGGAFRKYLHRALLASLRNGGPAGLFDHYYPLLYTPRSIENNKTAGYLALKARFIANNPQEQLEKHLHSTVKAKDDPSRLRDISCPVLYLAGEGDFLTDETSLKMLAEVTPRGSYKLLSLAGHNPYIEATSAFETAVVEFASENVKG